jgi:hypothetical protein
MILINYILDIPKTMQWHRIIGFKLSKSSDMTPDKMESENFAGEHTTLLWL